MYSVRVKKELGGRLDAEFYNPDALQAIERIRSVGEVSTLGDEIIEGYRVVYHGTDSVANFPENKRLGFLSPSQISAEGDIDFESVDELPMYYKEQYPRGLAKSGELLIEVKGNVSKVAVVPDEFPQNLMISGSLYKATLSVKADSRYALVFLRSKYGQLLKNRLTSNTIINYIGKEDLYSIPILLAAPHVQKYIGDKVRQAERLRAWAKSLQDQIRGLSSTAAIQKALTVIGSASSWVPSEDLTPRLDPKYYGNRALSVLHATEGAGVPLGDLVVNICNGFEEREFFEDGIAYITVSEVSSGRLDLSSAPLIHRSTNIPSKARINRKCVLVVRTGSIGTAVKVDERDTNAVISSHLIKLEFDNEGVAAAVACFLNSEGGKVLLRKISYGAVQPQIGQDELLAIPIPQTVVDRAEELLRLTTVYEDSIRSAKRLVSTSKRLVEALIEGLLVQQQFIDAQKALDADDASLDRDILARLTTKGLDCDGDPLFPDLDKLYDLLAQSQQLDE